MSINHHSKMKNKIIYITRHTFFNFQHILPSFYRFTITSSKSIKHKLSIWLCVFQINYNIMNIGKKQKKSRGSLLTKQLISKIYYSRTQEGYIKRYGNNKSYALELCEEMGRADKKRLTKIVQEVRATNDIFNKYLINRNICKLRPEDVLDFEDNIENDQIKETFKNTNKSTNFIPSKPTGQTALRKLNSDIVRIGFMMVLEKLKNDKVNHFINEVKYMKEIIHRQNQNLHQLGYEYAGIQNIYRNSQLIDQIAKQEKENGPFRLIGGKIRQETTIVQNASAFLKSIISR